ncbi:MAG: Asp-tRNA(Asn)/Glu-tRNA(Gln) amidotransferase subunit GatC [Deltaproteobacteria bacterium]
MKVDIEKVAKLARLRLSEDEKRRFEGQLDQILAHIEQLSRVDTTGVEPTSHAIPIHNAFREDEIKPSFPKDKVMGIAPAEEDGHFRVPRIID